MNKRGRSSSPAPKGGGDKKGNRSESTPPKLGQYCRAFLTPGGCQHGDKCIYPHMNESEVAKLKAAHKNALDVYNKKKEKHKKRGK